jgi:hypothetical protein
MQQATATIPRPHPALWLRPWLRPSLCTPPTPHLVGLHLLQDAAAGNVVHDVALRVDGAQADAGRGAAIGAAVMQGGA